MKSSSARVLSFCGWVFLLLLIDQATKAMARASLVEGQSVWIIRPVLEFTLIYNTGVAFGLLQNAGVFLTPVAVVVACIAGLAYVRSEPAERAFNAAMILVGAGALGNLIDRLFNRGQVTDFIDIQIIHVFNVADMCITIAVAILLLRFVLESRRTRSQASERQAD